MTFRSYLPELTRLKRWARPTRLPSRGYLVCSVERTGSSLFVEALRRTGLAGQPIEYFNRPYMQNNPAVRHILHGLNPVDGLPDIVRAGSTPNGIFGAKVHMGHFYSFGLDALGRNGQAGQMRPEEWLRASLPQLLPIEAALASLGERFHDLSWQDAGYRLLQAHLPDLRFIWVRRRNMVARAISHFIAQKTNLWWRSADSPAETGTLPEFDLAQIHLLHCLGLFYAELWQRFFDQHGIAACCIFYEDMVADYEGSIRRALTFLGVGDERTPIPKPESAIQADATSLEWEARYRSRFVGHGQ